MTEKLLDGVPLTDSDIFAKGRVGGRFSYAGENDSYITLSYGHTAQFCIPKGRIYKPDFRMVVSELADWLNGLPQSE